MSALTKTCARCKGRGARLDMNGRRRDAGFLYSDCYGCSGAGVVLTGNGVLERDIAALTADIKNDPEGDERSDARRRADVERARCRLDYVVELGAERRLAEARRMLGAALEASRVPSRAARLASMIELRDSCERVSLRAAKAAFLGAFK